MTDLQSVVTSLQFIATIVIAITLGFTAKTFLRLRKTEQVKLGERFYSDLVMLRKELDEARDPQQRKGVDWRIFTMVEWNALLINEKEISEKKLIKFFKDVFIDFYDDLLPKENKDNPEDYPEWKKLYKDIKLGLYG